MKIGILQTGDVPGSLVGEHGEYPSMFMRLLGGQGFKFETYKVVDNIFPESVRSCEGWLITGSVHGAYEPHAFIPPLEDFIREAYARNVPIAGICFGHQVMAQALGGKVVKFDGGWGVGHTEYQMSGARRAILAMHQDQVVAKPPEAEVIASNEFCENAGLAYKGKAISFQPHPEFTPEYMRDLIRYKTDQGAMSAEQAKTALEAVKDENDSGEIAAQLISFFLQAKAEQAA